MFMVETTHLLPFLRSSGSMTQRFDCFANKMPPMRINSLWLILSDALKPIVYINDFHVLKIRWGRFFHGL